METNTALPMASIGDENAQLRSRPLKLRRSAVQPRNFPKQTRPLQDRIASFARRIREKASLLPPGKEKDDLLRRARLADRIQSEQLGLFTPEIGRA
jgi:hypothetical protein